MGKDLPQASDAWRGPICYGALEKMRNRTNVRSSALISVAILATSLLASAQAHSEVWRSQGYGYLIETNAAAVKVYDVAADRCTLSDTVPTLSSLGIVEQRDADHFVLSGENSHIGFERVASLPEACARTEGLNSDPLVNFDALWRIFEVNYPSFAERKVDWQRIRATYRPRVAALGSKGDPWLIFTEMLSTLHDPHVHLVDSGRRFQTRRGDGSPIVPIQTALIDYLKGQQSPLTGGLALLAHDRLAVGVTSDNVGYIAVMTMGGFSAGPVGWPGNTTGREDRAAALAAMKTALDRVQGTKGLILDLRFNPGGSEDIAALIGSCFADQRRLAYERKARDGVGFGPSFPTFLAPGDCPKYDMPVIVLISERTTSAAEALVMRLRVLPQVQVLGQATQGAHSDVLNKTLPNAWKLGLSNEVYTLADGKIYEGQGIPPKIETAAPPADSPDHLRFGRDIVAASQRFVTH